MLSKDPLNGTGAFLVECLMDLWLIPAMRQGARLSPERWAHHSPGSLTSVGLGLGLCPQPSSLLETSLGETRTRHGDANPFVDCSTGSSRDQLILTLCHSWPSPVRLVLLSASFCEGTGKLRHRESMELVLGWPFGSQAAELGLEFGASGPRGYPVPLSFPPAPVSFSSGPCLSPAAPRHPSADRTQHCVP